MDVTNMLSDLTFDNLEDKLEVSCHNKNKFYLSKKTRVNSALC